MAGLVIIDNGTNAVRQIGETAASWLLRTGAYGDANAINLAARTAIDISRPNKKYSLAPEYIDKTRPANLQTQNIGSDYTGMRFLVGDIPVNNLILKNKNNDFIEFVNAKINVKKENTIVETVLVNRRGTIKEYINAKDYTVDISGDIMADCNCYPINLIREINCFLSKPEVFDVVNTYLDEYEISKLVFRNGDFLQQSQKFFNVLPFKFSFTSDNDEENAYGLIIDN